MTGRQPTAGHRGGLARSTAQCHLRRRAQDRRLRLSLRYGDTGRPAHRHLPAAATPR
ncbi:hypothetical protein ACFQ2M_02650 [Kitasatospora saccharophila]|uniref:hypothetical protein n=1 Tax=Kitasatospora saccharophila TaxID=407973 RepID=UPI0036393FB2